MIRIHSVGQTASPLRFAKPQRNPVSFGSLPAFPHYTAEQVKRGEMDPQAIRLFDALKNWANKGLQSSEAGKRCGFPHAIQSGSVEFAVCPATGNYRVDYEALRDIYAKLLDRFPTLTKQNAAQLNTKCLILAMPAYMNHPDHFMAMNNQARTDSLAKAVEKGTLNIGLCPQAGQPESFNVPFPLIAMRYLLPTDKPLIDRMQYKSDAARRFREVYE